MFTFSSSINNNDQDDLLMTPHAVDIGLDSMKHNIVKRVKKYQLM